MTSGNFLCLYEILLYFTHFIYVVIVIVVYINIECIKKKLNCFLSIYSLVADEVIFNSNYNQNSFLEAINRFFKLQPDFRPKNLKEKITEKCKVLYFPMKTITRQQEATAGVVDNVLHIVWPHRW